MQSFTPLPPSFYFLPNLASRLTCSLNLSAVGKTASACMQSIYPSVGYSVATSTQVTIVIGSSFPGATTAKPATCMFGTVRVPGYYSFSGGNTTISCTAPAPDDRLSATVPLSFSVDGKNFSPAGANFTYYSKGHDLRLGSNSGLSFIFLAAKDRL
jgi:hypothetical protein